MAANTAPIFTRTPDIQGVTTNLTANNVYDGTGTVETVFTADATEGGRVDKLILKPKGTNVTGVLRVFLNNGATNATATNNFFITDITLPTTAASTSLAQQVLEIALGISLPPGWKINVVTSVNMASGWQVTAVGGKY